MEKMIKTINMKKSNFPGTALFLGGFLTGMLIPNLSYRFLWKQQAFSAVYLLSVFSKNAISGTEYLYQILQMRGIPFFLCILCSFTVFGVPLAVGMMLLTGVKLGMILSMSILEFGLAGGVVSLGLLFPQYLFYLPVIFKVLELAYQESLGIWKNHGIFPRKIKSFLLQTVMYTMIYGIGIVLEWYINPWIVRQITRMINFF